MYYVMYVILAENHLLRADFLFGTAASVKAKRATNANKILTEKYIVGN